MPYIICFFRKETNQNSEQQNFKLHISERALKYIYIYRHIRCTNLFFQSVRTVRLQCWRNPWTKDTGVEQHLQKSVVPWRIEGPQHFSWMVPCLVSATPLYMLQAPLMHKLLSISIEQSNKSMKSLIFRKYIFIFYISEVYIYRVQFIGNNAKKKTGPHDGKGVCKTLNCI